MNGTNEYRILVVDDEEIARENLEHILSVPGSFVRSVGSGEEAFEEMKKASFDIVVTDLKMKRVDGLDVLQYTKEKHPDTEVVIVTGHGSIETAIEAMKRGAYDYITKPIRIDDVRITIQKALEKRKLRLELNTVKKEYNLLVEKPFLVGKSPKMQKIMSFVKQIAPTDCTVLITGETGTGKELIARAIHNYSSRSGGTFFPFNCAAFNEELLTNELFGHEKGAYTGAGAQKKGLLEVAAGGTVFLDEIGEMPLSMQVKLLRVLQEKKLIRLGGTREIEIDIRVIAATNRDLKQAVEEGTFRKDLFYRLNVVDIEIPGLAQRRDDIPLLAVYFVQKYSTQFNKEVEAISDEAMAALLAHDYEGNVRELENVIERAVAVCPKKVIGIKELPREMQDRMPSAAQACSGNETLTLEDIEKKHIAETIRKTNGNKTKAAEVLGIPRVSLWRKLKRYEMNEFL